MVRGDADPARDQHDALGIRSREGEGAERSADPAGLRSVVGLGRMLAHEIKNPLASITIASQTLSKALPVGEHAGYGHAWRCQPAGTTTALHPERRSGD